MALRANQAFVVATKDGKKRYEKDAVVPNDIAKGREALVYDDAPKAPAKKAAAPKADTED